MALTDRDINTVWNDPGQLSSDQKGWALKLKAEDKHDEAEFVTTSPFFYDGKLIVTSYTPEKISQDVCIVSERGIGRIYTLDVDTGRSLAKPVSLKNVKVTGVTGVRGRILFSAEEKRSGAMKEAAEKNPELRLLGDNLAEMRLARDGDLPLRNGVPYLGYWRDFDSEALHEMH